MPYLGNEPSTSFATVVKDSFSGDGSTTAFTLSKVATTNSVSVFVENVRQEPTTAYAVSGTTLTFTAAPVTSSGNNIYVLHMNPTTTTTHPSAQNLTAVDGTFTGTVTAGSTLDMNGTELILDADADTSITADTDDQIDIKIGGTDEVTLSSSGIVINEGSNDRDFRIESNGNANMINVDGGNDRVGIGISPSFNVQIDKSSTNTTLTDLTDAQLILSNTGTATTNQYVKLGFRFQDGSLNGQAMIAAVRESNSARSSSLRFYSAPSSDGDPDEAIRIDSNGQVTMPKQPAFCATMSANQNNLAANGGSHAIEFNTERFDQNADYNTGTYTFTAPVTGRYQINLYVRSDQFDQDTDHYRLRIDTSNRTYEVHIIDPSAYDEDVNYIGQSGSVLADMDANDTVTAKFFVHATGNGQVDLSEGHFSGYLVC